MEIGNTYPHSYTLHIQFLAVRVAMTTLIHKTRIVILKQENNTEMDTLICTTEPINPRDVDRFFNPSTVFHNGFKNKFRVFISNSKIQSSTSLHI
jgi:hypothetical protein